MIPGSGWTLKIVNNMFCPGMSIIVYRRFGGKIQFMAAKEPPMFEIKEISEGEILGTSNRPPALVDISISTMADFPDFLHQLQQELHTLGIKAPDKSFVEGKLDATQKHLEDLRVLLDLKENA